MLNIRIYTCWHIIYQLLTINSWFVAPTATEIDYSLFFLFTWPCIFCLESRRGWSGMRSVSHEACPWRISVTGSMRNQPNLSCHWLFHKVPEIQLCGNLQYPTNDLLMVASTRRIYSSLMLASVQISLYILCPSVFFLSVRHLLVLCATVHISLSPLLFPSPLASNPSSTMSKHSASPSSDIAERSPGAAAQTQCWKRVIPHIVWCRRRRPR